MNKNKEEEDVLEIIFGIGSVRYSTLYSTGSKFEDIE